MDIANFREPSPSSSSVIYMDVLHACCLEVRGIACVQQECFGGGGRGSLGPPGYVRCCWLQSHSRHAPVIPLASKQNACSASLPSGTEVYVTSHRPTRINLSDFFSWWRERKTVVETSVCSPFNYFARLVARGILILLRYARPEIYERWKYILDQLRTPFRLFQRPLASKLPAWLTDWLTNWLTN
jgi:hypothetical protein